MWFGRSCGYFCQKQFNCSMDSCGVICLIDFAAGLDSLLKRDFCFDRSLNQSVKITIHPSLVFNLLFLIILISFRLRTFCYWVWTVKMIMECIEISNFIRGKLCLKNNLKDRPHLRFLDGILQFGLHEAASWTGFLDPPSIHTFNLKNSKTSIDRFQDCYKNWSLNPLWL